MNGKEAGQGLSIASTVEGRRDWIELTFLETGLLKDSLRGWEIAQKAGVEGLAWGLPGGGGPWRPPEHCLGDFSPFCLGNLP